MATETLHCETCDEDFEREVKRGRKPKECPDCKNKASKPKTKPPVKPETLKAAEQKYKQRVQNAGKHFKPLGDPTKFPTAGGVLLIYKSYETDDGVVVKGSLLREKGLSNTYRFRALAVREDGTAYANLIGASGIRQGKHYSIGVQNLTL